MISILIVLFVAVASWILYLLIQSFALTKRTRAPRAGSLYAPDPVSSTFPVAVVQVVAKLEPSMMGQWELSVSRKAHETNVQVVANYLAKDAAVIVVAGQTFVVVQKLLGGNANGDDVYVLALPNGASNASIPSPTDYSTTHIMVFSASSNESS